MFFHLKSETAKAFAALDRAQAMIPFDRAGAILTADISQNMQVAAGGVEAITHSMNRIAEATTRIDEAAQKVRAISQAAAQNARRRRQDFASQKPRAGRDPVR